MIKLKMYKFYTLNEAEAATPKNGQCLVDSYWLVNDDGLIFYNCGDLVPQANRNKIIADIILKQNTPSRGECHVKMIPLVYIGQQHSLRGKVKLIEEDL